ncbi:hypothetical protein B0T17DRAFT_613782 [Bombardia bombarda]|uniref:Uncharacterized protein n=1 Tax=Bombardia bombarda TaxID=252184 RepID=A0AA39XP12_9PEZI|nr:hypothetical protein B0T17DRAFT_613782 [Bombardia bombarda]
MQLPVVILAVLSMVVLPVQAAETGICSIQTNECLFDDGTHTKCGSGRPCTRDQAACNKFYPGKGLVFINCT